MSSFLLQFSLTTKWKKNLSLSQHLHLRYLPLNIFCYANNCEMRSLHTASRLAFLNVIEIVVCGLQIWGRKFPVTFF